MRRAAGAAATAHRMRSTKSAQASRAGRRSMHRAAPASASSPTAESIRSPSARAKAGRAVQGKLGRRRRFICKDRTIRQGMTVVSLWRLLISQKACCDVHSCTVAVGPLFVCLGSRQPAARDGAAPRRSTGSQVTDRLHCWRRLLGCPTDEARSAFVHGLGQLKTGLGSSAGELQPGQ